MNRDRQPSQRSLGVDVSVRRGLDLVLLDGSPPPAMVKSRVQPKDLSAWIADLRPDVVAIDSPPAWGSSGGSRLAERELRKVGIQSYGTPAEGDKSEHPFFAWMKVGFRAFKAAEAAGFPRYRKGSLRQKAIEVFPHATAVILAGCLPPARTPRKRWRASVLEAQGIKTEALRSRDQVDAALAALTGLYVMKGDFTALGDPEEGVIVVPRRDLPTTAYRRCPASEEPEPQLRLPGLSPCACGDPQCREMTSHEFAPGHDAKRKSALWLQARRGEEAVRELKRRGWKLPPEIG